MADPLEGLVGLLVRVALDEINTKQTLAVNQHDDNNRARLRPWLILPDKGNSVGPPDSSMPRGSDRSPRRRT